MSDLRALLARLDELHAQLTPGEWVTERRGFGYPEYEGGPIRYLLDVRSDAGASISSGTIERESDANQQFIAAMKNAYPILRAALARTKNNVSDEDCYPC